MELLERDRYLEGLEKTFSRLTSDGGCVVLISGEAGIGKTSLVERFAKMVGNRARILWGNCDALFTPRPLGPLYDIAGQLKNGLLTLLNDQVPRATIFSTFFNDLQETKLPNVVIIEDAHWADESTLDLIKLLARRVDRLNSIFIVTYRDDEISSSHPMRLVLGDIPPQKLIKYRLQPLTEKTVNSLADSIGIENLFQVTGGNPFFITELLSNKDEGIPSNIKNSVLSRISRLTREALNLVELVSIIPARAEKWLIEGVLPVPPELLEECVDSGILRFEDGAISFRHELSRMAVEEALSASKRQLFNKKILQILLKQKKIDNYLARIIHHALRVPDKKILIQYSPLAAKQASVLSAHSLAAYHYQNALQFVGDIPLDKRLDLYEGRSYECYLTGQIAESIKACEAIIEILKKCPDPQREGENYRRMSRSLWYAGQDNEAKKCLDKAVEILEKLPPCGPLAMTYSNLSQFYMCRGDLEKTIKWGDKASEMAKELNNREIEAHSLNNVGTTIMFAGDDTGEYSLKKSLEISLGNDFHEHAARAYDNLGCVYQWRRNLREADRYFSIGIDYSNEKDIDTLGLCMEGCNTKTKLYRGDWDDALETALSVLKRENVPLINKIAPLYVVGVIKARRNDPGALSVLNELKSIGLNIGEIVEMIVPIKAARAEAFWLWNRLDDVIDEVASVYNTIKDRANPWAIGELAFWLWKGNRLTEIPEKIAEPFLIQIKGDWKSAAKIWEELQCPYEQAIALTDGNEDAMKKALDIFDHLGATATLEHTKQKMREIGIKRIPKGPRKATRKNPAGLTARQLEILNLLGKGLSNIEIGNRLYISPKTVDHHISAIFSKLDVHSRFEAAAFVHSYAMTEK